MRYALIALVLLVAGCDLYKDPTGPTPNELYALVCVDSTLVYPTYDCAHPPNVTEVTIVIENPFPVP